MKTATPWIVILLVLLLSVTVGIWFFADVRPRLSKKIEQSTPKAPLVAFPQAYTTKPTIDKIAVNGGAMYEIKGWLVQWPEFNGTGSLIGKFQLDGDVGRPIQLVWVFFGVRDGTKLIGKGSPSGKFYKTIFTTKQINDLSLELKPFWPLILRVTITDANKKQEETISIVQDYLTTHHQMPAATTLIPDAISILD